MLIRYILLLIVFNDVYSKHVLNKIPVKVPKPVKLSKGLSSSHNQITNGKNAGASHRDKLTVDIGDDNEKELLVPASKGDITGNEEKELLLSASKGDDEDKELLVPANKKDQASDGEKEMLIPRNNENGDEAETEMLIPGGNEGDDGEQEMLIPGDEKGDDGGEEKESLIPSSSPPQQGDDDDISHEGKKMEYPPGYTPPKNSEEQREKGFISPAKKYINKSNDDTIKLKHEYDEENYNDHLLDRYHPEKVSFMQDDISASWPLGIIPYHFDTSSFDDILAARIRDSMDVLEHSSCLQFRALSGRNPENHTWIHITNPWRQRECSHIPKRKSSGEIVLVLGLDCLKQRDILHSLLHAIGFNDEVTHPHRDQYIRIMWENIQPAYQRLFSIIPRHKKMLVEYDPMSIMHFHDRAFSKNGQATISVMMPGLQIQPSDKLSQLDKMQLRLAFGHECNRRTVDKIFDTCKTVLRTHQSGDGEMKLRKIRPVPMKNNKKEPLDV